MPGSKTFGERLRRERTHRKLTQREAAARFILNGEPIAQPSYYRWESGDTLPKEPLWPDVASFLGCSIDELYQLMHNEQMPSTMAGVDERLAEVERSVARLTEELGAIRKQMRER